MAPEKLSFLVGRLAAFLWQFVSDVTIDQIGGRVFLCFNGFEVSACPNIGLGLAGQFFCVSDSAKGCGLGGSP